MHHQGVGGDPETDREVFVLRKTQPERLEATAVGALDLVALGFEGVEPEATGRPAYHPATMLKIYLYGVSQQNPVDASARAGSASKP
jgi:hypothetical protein